MIVALLEEKPSGGMAMPPLGRRSDRSAPLAVSAVWELGRRRHLPWPGWLPGREVRICKRGHQKMAHDNSIDPQLGKRGGIDVAKASLDAAIWPGGAHLTVPNNAAGWGELADWFHQAGVTLAAVEASGGYERGVVGALRAKAFDVAVLMPIRVRAFARFLGRHAKTDRIDAELIAQCARSAGNSPADPSLQPIADTLTCYEQIAEDLARQRTRLEGVADPDLKAIIQSMIAQFQITRKQLLLRLRQLACKHQAVHRRIAQLSSLPGIGFLNAISLAVRMPELGQMSRQQAAALIGLAPYNRDSGTLAGRRRIAGGRARPRRMLYMAGIAAIRSNAEFKAFYQRLIQAGKPHNVALVAVMRKLVVLANVILKRDSPWQPQRP
jgi:transposase